LGKEPLIFVAFIGCGTTNKADVCAFPGELLFDETLVAPYMEAGVIWPPCIAW
jgi:hypothetical protein